MPYSYSIVRVTLEFLTKNNDLERSDESSHDRKASGYVQVICFSLPVMQGMTISRDQVT